MLAWLFDSSKVYARHRLIAVSLTLVLYVVAYVLVFPLVGLPGALAVFPAIVAGWLYNRQGGFLIGIFIALLTAGLSIFSSGSVSRVASTWLGLTLIPVISGAIGWSHEIYEYTRRQAQELKTAQAELSRLNAQLEVRVQERVDEIFRLNADLELRVAARTEELTAANAQLEAYNNMVAHDLRAPLTMIQSYNDLLLLYYVDQKMDEQGLQMLRAIQDSTQRMRGLIQDLFDFSRAKDDALLQQAVDLSSITQVVVKELREREPDRQVAVTIAPNLIAYGDERFLRVLLDNLLGNAWKYSGQTKNACIEVGAKQLDNQSAYFVEDNGIGLDMNNAEKLFQPFQRLTGEFPGTGLGLATCKRIVERHGGRIWVEAQLGRGCTFYFTLGRSQPGYS